MNGVRLFFFFFFFQAEDGIRDLTVTGVQTCALPIYEWYTLLDDVAAGTEGAFMRIGPARRRAAIERAVAILEGAGTPFDPRSPLDPLDRVCFGRMLADVWFRPAPAAAPGVRRRLAGRVSA